MARSRRIDTPYPGALRRHMKKYETVKYGQFAVILDRPRAGGKMPREICHGHLPTRDKRGRPSGETDRDQRSRDELDQARNAKQREQWDRSAVHTAE